MNVLRIRRVATAESAICRREARTKSVSGFSQLQFAFRRPVQSSYQSARGETLISSARIHRKHSHPHPHSQSDLATCVAGFHASDDFALCARVSVACHSAVLCVRMHECACVCVCPTALCETIDDSQLRLLEMSKALSALSIISFFKCGKGKSFIELKA